VNDHWRCQDRSKRTRHSDPTVPLPYGLHIHAIAKSNVSEKKKERSDRNLLPNGGDGGRLPRRLRTRGRLCGRAAQKRHFQNVTNYRLPIDMRWSMGWGECGPRAQTMFSSVERLQVNGCAGLSHAPGRLSVAGSSRGLCVQQALVCIVEPQQIFRRSCYQGFVLYSKLGNVWRHEVSCSRWKASSEATTQT